MSFNKHKNIIFIFLLTVISGFLHFYNLNWGAPFYFHPDERNIASSVSQLAFPQQMNPHFFAYGTLPIYTIYFTSAFTNFFSHCLTRGDCHIFTVPFEQALLISRFYSALFATLLIPLLFVIGKKMHNENAGLLAAFLATTSVGFTQFAHFGTFEMWLTFFTVVLFWLCLQKLTVKLLLRIGVVFGVLVATKVSSLVLFLLPLIVIPAKSFVHKSHKNAFVFVLKNIGSVFIMLLTAVLIYLLTNPYVFLSFSEFKDSMQYESGVALGTLPIFYTGEFYKSIPVIFHFLHIYPFLLNPLITILFILCFFSLLFVAIKRKEKNYLLLLSFFLVTFLSQAFFYVKWTRYLMPTLPFIYLICSIVLSELSVIARSKTTKQSPMRLPRASYALAMTTIIFVSFLFAVSYFVTAFVRPDTRVAAYTFAQSFIPPNATMVSEIYDMGIVPFNETYHTISLFHFYDLDNNSPTATNDSLQRMLTGTSYIILPSQRILKTRLLDKTHFPNANAFYQALTAGSLGYQKIYETPCDFACQIAYLGDPIFRYEETANVFDRPTVMIFKKSL